MHIAGLFNLPLFMSRRGRRVRPNPTPPPVPDQRGPEPGRRDSDRGVDTTLTANWVVTFVIGLLVALTCYVFVDLRDDYRTHKERTAAMSSEYEGTKRDVTEIRALVQEMRDDLRGLHQANNRSEKNHDILVQLSKKLGVKLEE